MKLIALKLIRLYQRTLSFDHGPLAHFYPAGYCPYKPTCSQYTYEAVGKYGFFKGSSMGLKRIFRCTPWTKGGEDPVK